MRRLSLALALALLFYLMSPTPVLAQDLNPKDYFQLNYNPVTFDKSEINRGEVFNAIISGSATCTKDLPVPLPITEVVVSSQVVAEHAVSGAVVTLNPSYTVNIKPFPSKKDETVEINQPVPLQFPIEAEPGDYNIIGRIHTANIKLVFGSLEITSYLPPEQPMGTVKYTASESTAAASAPVPSATKNPPSSEHEPEPLTPESIPSEPNIPPPQGQAAPPPPQQVVPWWAWMIIVLAAATLVTNIISLLMRRAR